MIPFETQVVGAKFLADRASALLADEPRCGKTGAIVMAADDILANKILVVTTASGRAVWQRAFRDWSAFPRKPVQILMNSSRLDPSIPCAIVGWSSLAEPKVRAAILGRQWDLIVGDEDHYAKSFESKRTQAFWGTIFEDGKVLSRSAAVTSKAPIVWVDTGTPLPNSPFDMYPRLRALAPERLAADPARGWPDVTTQTAFKKSYCVVRPMTIGRGCYKRRQEIIVGGRNEAELNARLEGFMLLRTQADVGIGAPMYDTLPLLVSDAVRQKVDAGLDTRTILAAAEAGDTQKLDMLLGPLRRLTGEIKARAVVEFVRDEFECGLDKIVLMRWHKEVGHILREGLSQYGVVRLDGSSSPDERRRAEEQFRDDPKTRVFDGQIAAAGEAIDLSAAATLIFIETSPVPKDMKQASLRITNHTQRRQALVRVATLAGSIDERLQQILLRKWSSIREVLKQ